MVFKRFEQISKKEPDQLDCRSANDALDYGNGLAPFLFRPEVYEKAEEEIPHPPLPDTTGACSVLVVWENLPENSIIRPAIILPLCWKNDSPEHSAKLPEGLRKLAGEVVEQLNATGWTLQCAVSFPADFCNISSSKEKWESAWAPLYGALRLAIDGLLPDSTVFATGAWEDGLKGVSGLAAKAKVAYEWGAKKFFYPENCALSELAELAKVKSAFAEEIELIAIRNEKKHVAAMSPYLAFLASEPGVDPSVTVEQLDAYYLITEREKRQGFYLKRIKEKIVERAFQNSAQDVEKGQNRTLVCWISGGNELIDVSIETFKPRRVILFKTKDFDTNDAVKTRIEKNYPSLQVEQINLEKDLTVGQLKKKINEQLSQRAPGEALLLDLTSGKVSMSLSLYDYQKTDSDKSGYVTDIRYLYWDKKIHSSNLPIPRTTTPSVW